MEKKFPEKNTKKHNFISFYRLSENSDIHLQHVEISYLIYVKKINQKQPFLVQM